MSYVKEPPQIPRMKFSKTKRHLEQLDMPLSNPEDIFGKEMFAQATEEEWAARAKLKKIDANDIANEGGRDAFTKFLVSTPTYLFHKKESPIIKLSRLWKLYPEMKQPIIQGLLRRGEIMNIVAAPKCHKCVAGSTLVQDASSGVLTSIRALCDARGSTIAFDPSGGGSVYRAKARDWTVFPETKECLRVETRLGNAVDLTPEHRLLTPDGWKEAQHLKPGDQIVCAAKVPEPQHPVEQPESEVALLACLLTEGGCTQTTPTFSNSCPIFVDFMKRHAEQCGFKVNYRGQLSYSILGGRALLNKYGLGREKSIHKWIPDQIFQLPNRLLRIFLMTFWWGEGNGGSGVKPPVMCLSCEKMIDQVKFLFLRFGVVLKKNRSFTSLNGRRFLCWTLTVQKWCIENFKNVVAGIQGDLGERLSRIPSVKKPNTDSIAVSAWHSILLTEAARWNTANSGYRRPRFFCAAMRSIGCRRGFNLKTDNLGRSMFPRRALRAIVAFDRAYDQNLAWMVSPEITFDTIEDIRHIGPRQVYDIQADENENFIGNQFVLHNSFMGLNLAMSVISGGQFFGRFDCTRGKTLVIDNELHPETINPRTKVVAEASNVPLFYAGDLIDYISLRGELTDVFSLASYLDDIRPKYYSLVILDALYRFYPPDFDENSNADMARLYNHLDVYANTLDSAFVVIHHTSKFSQSGKRVTDVGAGAGSLTRACDSHMIIRPLNPDDEDDNTVRIDAVTRSFPQIRPFCATFKYPIWAFNPDADPDDIKIDQRAGGRATQAAEAKAPIEAYLSSAIAKPSSIAEIVVQGAFKNFKPWSRDSVRLIIYQLVKDGKMRQVDGASGKKAATYISANITPNSNETPVAVAAEMPPESQPESEPFDAEDGDSFTS